MGLTSVASQHRARPSGDAPYTTRSRRRRSDVGTPGADVCDSHCWGTTCPSAPTASRQTASQACSTSFARRAKRPLRVQASAWSPQGSSLLRHPCPCWPQRPGPKGRGIRRRLRSAICMTSGGSEVDLSVGMAVSHPAAWGPDWDSNSAW